MTDLTSTAAGYADAAVTLAQLRAIAPRAPAETLDPLNAAMHEASIATPARQAAFIAQVAFESDQFTAFEERWGPTVDQIRYERPVVNGVLLAPLETDPRHAPLWQRLGNLQPGDGHRYRGRGAIQLTGRANYRACGAALGLDLEGHPELAAAPEHRYRVSTWYWNKHGLNGLADDGDFVGITRAINGLGMYGLRQRQANYDAALKALGVAAVCAAPAP